MNHTVLLYGATGYSGRLIAAEGARTGMAKAEDVPGYQMILAGRDGREVAKLASALAMDHRVFGIDDRATVVRGLSDIDVVINAAGPFALTADHLAKGALAAGCHYVDINGETDVYMKLDDLGRHAAHRERALVVSAGHTAAASDMLLDVALGELNAAGLGPAPARTPAELGAVRIGFSRLTTPSRGSLETLWRSLREQVRVVRLAEPAKLNGARSKEHVIWHEPIGKLERVFDFSDRFADNEERAQVTEEHAPDSQGEVGSAANLVDTLTARLNVERHNFAAHRIESYVEVGTIGRLTYQFGPLLTPLAAMPWARDLARLQFDALPSGPTPRERRQETHVIVLEIEDVFQELLLHWAWHTTNTYNFTARVVVEVAKRVAAGDRYGWLTPAEVLQPTKDDLCGGIEYLRGCALDERRSPVREMV
jgi:short subunit dehydrogenase-like uncharacterized protein